MQTTRLRFSGFQHFLCKVDEDDKEKFQKHPNLRTLKPEIRAKVEVKAIHKGVKLTLPDKSTAYLHPFQTNSHYRVGAYKLSKGLKFNLVPKIKAVKLNDFLQYDQVKTTSKVGTICEWIPGETYHDFYAKTPQAATSFDKKNIAELYLFSLISMDSDFHDRNIIVGPKTGEYVSQRLYAIDSEKTGARPEELLKTLNKFPESLSEQVAGEDIPRATLEHIKAFLADRPNSEHKLKRYSPRQIDAMYNMASLLALKEEIPRPQEVESLIKKASMPSKPPTPKMQSPTRSHSVPNLNYFA
jgi:hypothetical protein